MAGIFDGQQRNSGRSHCAGIDQLRGDQAVEGSADFGEADCGAGFGHHCVGLRTIGVSGIAARLGQRQLSRHLVVFVRAHGLLVVEHLVALHGRFGQHVVGIGGSNALARSLESGRGVVSPF